MVVDSRNNAGGDLVSDLTMFFTGKKYIEYGKDTRMFGSEPPFRWTKPTVAMFHHPVSASATVQTGSDDLAGETGTLVRRPVVVAGEIV